MSPWRCAPALLLALAGCASVVAPPPGDVLSGRLSVRVENDAARSFNAAFELTGSAERGSLALSSPLGVQLAQADWSAEQVSLRSRDGERRYADLDSLAVDAFGERMPLAALFDWLRGRPWPGAPYSASDGGFAQLGWSVDMSRRAEGWVQAQRAAPPAVTVRAKLDLP